MNKRKSPIRNEMKLIEEKLAKKKWPRKIERKAKTSIFIT